MFEWGQQGEGSSVMFEWGQQGEGSSVMSEWGQQGEGSSVCWSLAVCASLLLHDAKGVLDGLPC